MVHSFEGKEPRIDGSAFIAWNAEVMGDARLDEGVTVWFGATLRADIAPIIVGKDSNVQDGSVIHVTTGVPCRLGVGVTVGHGAIIHSATVADYSLIGMGAIILDGARIGEESIVGAGALVTQNKSFPPRSMILGSPAKAVRELSPEEIESLHAHAREYVALGKKAKAAGGEAPSGVPGKAAPSLS
jgi:carbonic anhydrase/acetyltransferase-like protein (isoleucine patch superfamily)